MSIRRNHVGRWRYGWMAIILLAGCAPNPVKQAYAFLDDVLALLEQHRDHAPQAAAAVQAYVGAHEAELRTLNSDLRTLRDRWQTDPAARLEALETMQPLLQRLSELDAKYPALLEEPKVQAALKRLEFR